MFRKTQVRALDPPGSLVGASQRSQFPRPRKPRSGGLSNALLNLSCVHQSLGLPEQFGGGNFGVCTSLEYKLHPVQNVYWGPMFYEVEEAENIFKFYREYIKDAPEEMGAFPAFQIAPPLPFIPEDRHGDMFAGIVACWSGDPAEGERQFKA